MQHANYFLEGLAPLERVQVAYSLFKAAHDEIHSVQLSFGRRDFHPCPHPEWININDAEN